jgi:hypothetical protein
MIAGARVGDFARPAPTRAAGEPRAWSAGADTQPREHRTRGDALPRAQSAWADTNVNPRGAWTQSTNTAEKSSNGDAHVVDVPVDDEDSNKESTPPHDDSVKTERTPLPLAKIVTLWVLLFANAAVSTGVLLLAR